MKKLLVLSVALALVGCSSSRTVISEVNGVISKCEANVSSVPFSSKADVVCKHYDKEGNHLKDRDTTMSIK